MIYILFLFNFSNSFVSCSSDKTIICWEKFESKERLTSSNSKNKFIPEFNFDIKLIISETETYIRTKNCLINNCIELSELQENCLTDLEAIINNENQ